MSNETQAKPAKSWMGWGLFAAIMVVVFGAGLLLATILERRQEAIIQTKTLTTIAPLESDNAKWAANWPREYSSFKQTQDSTTKTKYGGSDPRDLLAETPTNIVLFAGNPFSKDYRQARGHWHAREDAANTHRINDKSPATCWTCKSPDVPRVMAELGEKKLGEKSATATMQEKVLAGAEDFYAEKFANRAGEVTHPIGCLDCHDPSTMQLRITRPALIEAYQRQGKNINEVSHQEMRTLVCAQCHVEYYFKGDKKYLTFPWDKGMSPEKMEEYYDAIGFSDWTHTISKTPMLKMQHPDYEVYSTGIHAYRGVSCADCHMPYRTEGGAKFSDHHLQSPLLNIANSCQVCHRWSEDDIRNRVTSIQDKVREGRDRAEVAIAFAHFDIAACMEAGAKDEELENMRKLVRRAQMRWDYVAANNGMGFHSPGECQRILSAAIDLALQARVEAARVLARHGYTDAVQYPPFHTKEAATETISAWDPKADPSKRPSLLKKKVASASQTSSQ